MKYHYLLLCIISLMFSCTKSSNSTSVPLVIDSTQIQKFNLVDSTIQAANKTMTRFSYDQNKQIASILIHSFWYSGPNLVEDTFLMTFHFTANNPLPNSYDYIWYTATNTTDATEHHLLYYDNLNRIILDSMVSATTTMSTDPLNVSNAQYIYNPDNIIIQQFTNFVGSGNPQGSPLINTDTIYLSNGNVTKESLWYLGGSAPEFFHATSYSYTSYHNPLFQTEIAQSLGAFLFHNHAGDFISKNFMNPYLDPVNQYPFSFVTDSSGNLTDIYRIENGGGNHSLMLQFKYK